MTPLTDEQYERHRKVLLVLAQSIELLTEEDPNDSAVAMLQANLTARAHQAAEQLAELAEMADGVDKYMAGYIFAALGRYTWASRMTDFERGNCLTDMGYYVKQINQKLAPPEPAAQEGGDAEVDPRD